MDSLHLTEEQKDARLLGDLLAIVIDEEDAPSSVALATLRQRARQRRVTGGTLRTLFKSLAEHERQAFLSPEKFQDELRQKLHKQEEVARELAQRHRQLQSDHAFLQEENTLFRQHNEDYLKQTPLRRLGIAFALIIGCIFGIAGTQFAHTLTTTHKVDPAVCLH